MQNKSKVGEEFSEIFVSRWPGQNVRVLADSSFVLCADFHNMTLRCVLKVTHQCTVYSSFGFVYSV